MNVKDYGWEEAVFVVRRSSSTRTMCAEGLAELGKHSTSSVSSADKPLHSVKGEIHASQAIHCPVNLTLSEGCAHTKRIAIVVYPTREPSPTKQSQSVDLDRVQVHCESSRFLCGVLALNLTAVPNQASIGNG
jgi:hypothetical protein